MTVRVRIFYIVLCSLVVLSLSSSSSFVSSAGGYKGWGDSSLVSMYHDNSDLQRTWALSALSKLGRLRGDESVLDYGSGDGKVSSIISFMVPNGFVQGVDISSDMLDFARRIYSQETYCNLGFSLLDDPTFSPGNELETFDLVVSFCVFHLIKDPLTVLKNIGYRMKPNSRLVLTWPIGNNPNYYQAICDTVEKHNLTLPEKTEDQLRVRNLNEAGSILEKAGFNVEKAEIVSTHNPFINKQKMIDWFMGTLVANWDIPEDIRETFCRDLADRFIELSPESVDEDGGVYLDMQRIDLLASKE